MAFFKSVSKTEPIELPVDNGALDLSVSSPRRAPSASLSDSSPPNKLLQSPPRGVSQHSKPNDTLDNIGFPPNASLPCRQDLSFRPSVPPNQQNLHKPPSLSHVIPGSQQYRTTLPQKSPPKQQHISSSSITSTGHALSAGNLDLEKLRKVHQAMEHRPPNLMSQARPKMPVPPQNRPTVTHSATMNAAMKQPTQTLKLPPPPGADSSDFPPLKTQSPVNSRNNTQQQQFSLQRASSMTSAPSNASAQHPHHQLLPANSYLRIQPGGMVNLNGQPMQLLTRLPSNQTVGKTHVSSGVSNTTGSHLLKIAPDTPMAISNGNNSKIQPKPSSQKQILPAPSTNGQDLQRSSQPVSNQLSLIDGAALTLAVQQAQAGFQKSLVRSDSDSSKGQPNVVASKCLNPQTFPQHHKYPPQSHRPIMPKPSRQGPPPQSSTQVNPQPVIYLCTLPTAPVQPQPSNTVPPTQSQPLTQETVQQNNTTAKVAPQQSNEQFKEEHKTPPLQTTSASSQDEQNSSSATPLSSVLPITFQFMQQPLSRQVSSLPKETPILPRVTSPPKSVAIVEPAEKSTAQEDSKQPSPIKQKRSSTASEPSSKSVSNKDQQSDNDSKKSTSKLLIKEKFKKNRAKKRPNIITHIIDGFVILESDQPILNGTLAPLENCVGESEQDSEPTPSALKRRRRVSSSEASGSVAAANSSAQTSPASRSSCSGCSSRISTVNRGVKSHVFMGQNYCNFQCLSRAKREYMNKRKIQGSEDDKARSASPHSPLNRKKEHALPPYLTTPLPPAPAIVTPTIQQTHPQLNAKPSFESKSPQQWTMQDVGDFIRSIPGCEEAAQKFIEQEIDGPALLSCTSDVMANLMGLKVGPILKISRQLQILTGSANAPPTSASVNSSPPAAAAASARLSSSSGQH